jgi:hypothetical protein
VYHCKTTEEKMEIGWNNSTSDHQFSPMFVYNQLVTSPSQGAFVSTVMETLVQQGCDTINFFPVQTDAATWTKKLPDAASMARASAFKGGSHKSLGGDINAIKNELAAGNPVVFSFPVFNDFYLNSANTIYDNFSGTLAGYHAVCVVGYDDAKQAFKFANSWGTGYGSGGYGWMAYSICSRGDFASDVLYNANNSPEVTIISGAIYELVAQCSGKALDVNGASTAAGAKVQQWTRNGSAAQKWRINDMGNGLKLVAQCSGMALDCTGWGTANGTKIEQWNDNGGACQRFGCALYGSYWKFWTVMAGGRCIDVSGASTADGAQIQLWDDNGGSAQRWALYRK